MTSNDNTRSTDSGEQLVEGDELPGSISNCPVCDSDEFEYHGGPKPAGDGAKYEFACKTCGAGYTEVLGITHTVFRGVSDE